MWGYYRQLKATTCCYFGSLFVFFNLLCVISKFILVKVVRLCIMKEKMTNLHFQYFQTFFFNVNYTYFYQCYFSFISKILWAISYCCSVRTACINTCYISVRISFFKISFHFFKLQFFSLIFLITFNDAFFKIIRVFFRYFTIDWQKN